MQPQINRRIPAIDSKCWDIIVIPMEYKEISSNVYKVPGKKYELIIKKRGYCIVHSKSRRVLFDTGLNPTSFADIVAKIINLIRQERFL